MGYHLRIEQEYVSDSLLSGILNYFLNRLLEVWREMFLDQYLDISSVEQCPMLIGVMRRSAGETGWSFPSDYQFTVLLKNDTVLRTGEKPTREMLLC